MRNSARALSALTAKACRTLFSARRLTLVTALVLSTLVRAQTYTPVALTGFNADVIANGPTFAGSVNADVDGGNFYFLNQSFTAFGVPTFYLPTTGLINSSITPGLSFQLADASGNNSLRLATLNATGTLNFATPQNAGIVYVLATSGSGTSLVNITVNFTDASAQTFSNLSIADWFATAASTVQGIGRTSATALDNGAGATNPKLFQLPLALSGTNLFKTIASITVTKVNATGTGFAQIMGVTLAAPCTAPVAQPTSLVLNATSTSAISGAFTAASPAADQYLVVRYPVGATPVAPVNGTTYAAGTSLGTGVVVQAGSATTFNASGLNAATAYTFYVYAFNSTNCIGPVYATAAPLSATQSTNNCANISGVITVGPTGAFPSITAAFNSFSAGISGPVILELQATYNVSAEPSFPITLGFVNCFSAVNTLTIRPATGATGLIITSSNAGPTIDFNGAKYITIDGRPGGTGTISQLSIINTSSTGLAIRFINDAQNNTITYCDVQGQNSSAPANPAITQAGVIYFGAASATGLQGNDNNTISFCDIHGTATGTPSFGILASTSAAPATDAAYNDNGVISNNRIYDVYSVGGQSNFVKLDIGSNAWTISNNSFYETTTRNFTSGNTHRAIWITPGTTSTTTANGFIVNSNFIGGTAPNAGGTPLTITGNVPSTFWGMDISVGLGTPTSVQGNTIKNLDITTTATGAPAGFMGISQNQGNINIGTIASNTIGSATGNGSITVTAFSGTSASVLGIRISGGTSAQANISNNNIGGITTIGSGTVSLGVTGIQISGGTTVTVNNNTIGSVTTSNSINASSATTGLQSVIGINAPTTATGTISITNNTIANLNNNYIGTGSGLTDGIVIAASGTPVFTPVSGNTIRNLTSSSAGTGTGVNSAIAGIVSSNTNTAGIDITGNTIHSLSLTTPTAGVFATGIFYNGSSSVNSNINKNFIHSFDVTSATNISTTLTGIDYSSATATIANNMIRLGIRPDGSSLTNEATIRGISSNSGSIYNRIVFNSIYIGGTGVGTSAKVTYAFTRTSANSGTYDIRNNIFVNNRSNATTGGKHYAIFFTTGVSNVTADYNIYQYAGTGGVFASNGVADVATYSSTWIPGDTHSLVVDPLFVSPASNAATVNLHIQTGSSAEGTGIDIPGINDDIDGQSRATLSPVDIGADAGNYAVNGVDVGINALVDPGVGVCYSATQTVTVRLKNYSANTISFATTPVTVTVTATGGYSSSIIVNTGTLAAGATMNVTLPATINMSAAGPYTFNATATAAGDLNAANNAMAAETRTVVAGTSLSGTYTVGAGGNYTTLTAAIAAYNAASCLSGNVSFVLTDALYSTAETFPISMNANGSPFTLTIKPAAGNAATITGTSGASANALIKLNGADNVIIDGLNTGGSSLTIENTSATSGTAVIWLISNGINNGATNNVIRNTTIKGGIAQNTSTNVSYGIVIAGTIMSSTTTSVTSGDDNDNNTIENNTFIKLRYGIYTRGGSAFNPNNGTIIRNNIIGPTAFGVDEIGRAGILIREEDGIQITGNEIRFVGGNFANTSSGADRMAIAVNADATWPSPTNVYLKNALIAQNRIHDIAEERLFSSVGIFVGAVDGLNTTNNTIANNMLFNILSNGTGGDQTVGILLNAGNGDKAVYNSIYLTGDTDPNVSAGAPSTSSFALSIGSTSELNPQIVDNILYMDLSSSSAPTLKHAAINIPSSYVWGTGRSNFNDLYINTGNGQSNIGTIGGSGGTNYSTLTTWQAASLQDANSVSVLPVFFSATDLHLIPGLNVGINDKGTPVAGITTDIDGQTRSVTPDPGADEFVLPLGVDVSTSTLVTPVVKSCYSNAEAVSVSIKNFAANPLDFSSTPVTVTLNVTGAASVNFTKIVNTGTLAPGDSLIVVFAGTLDMSTAGTYNFNATATTPTDVNNANDAMTQVVRTVVAVNGGTVTANNTQLCLSGTPVLSLAGNAGGSIQWRESTSVSGPFTNVGTNSTSYTPASPITSTMYYQAVVSCNANNATSNTLQVAVNNPQILTTSPGTRCGPGQVILTGTASAGATLNWYAAPSGGTPLATGNIFTTAVIPNTTTFYVSASIGTCESVRQAVIANVNPAPALALTSASTVCNGSIKALTITSPLGNFDNYTWSPQSGLYVDAAAAFPYTGTNASTVYVKQTTGGVYTYTVTANNTSTSCQNIDSVKITVLPAPITIDASPSQICVSGTSTLTLTPAAGYGTASFQWQTSTDNINFTNIAGAIGGTYTTPTLSSTTYYRAIIKDAAGNSCVQPGVTLTVNNPQVLTTTPAILCSNGPVTLNATGTAGSTIRWYAAASGGAPLGSGTSFVTPALTSTTTYYAAAENGIPPVGLGTQTSTGFESPYNHVWGGKKSQYLILASELAGLGLTGNNITAIGFNVVSVGTSYNNFSISLKNTTAPAMTGTLETGLTTVYTASSVTPVLGINNYTFLAPFNWDGTSNVIVEVCWSNNNTGGTTANVRVDPTSFVSHAYYRNDSQTQAVICGTTTATATQSLRPQIFLNNSGYCQGNRVAVVATISGPTTITQQPTPQTGCVGGSLTLSVTATGAGLSYQWKRGTTNVGTNSNTITLNPLALTDAGSYTVVVTGPCGTVTSSAVNVVVGSGNNWIGGISTDWNTAGNWCGGVPSSTTDVTIPSGTVFSPVINGQANVRNITISTGATLTLTPGGSFNVFGDYANSGTFNAGSGFVFFRGSTNQNVGALTAANVVVNGSGGITLGGNMNSATLILQNGNITLGSNSLTTTGSVNGSVASHIVTNGTGSVISNNIGTGPVIIPVGPTATSYNPVMIANGQGRNYTVTVASGITPAMLDNTRAVNRTWNITPSSAVTSNVSVTLQYDNAHGNANFNGNAAVEVGRHNGTIWTIATPPNGTIPLGPATDRQATIQTTAFGPMAVTSPGGITYPTALPNVNTDVLGMALMPNAVQSNTVMRVVVKRSMKMAFTVVDAGGKEVMHFNSAVVVGLNDIPLQFMQLKSGMYFIRGITDKGKTEVVRFVKL